jgi:hypothetical protein
MPSFIIHTTKITICNQLKMTRKDGELLIGDLYNMIEPPLPLYEGKD